ncbi:ficolin-1 [Elysia marginata]|uniref:Ficolin-1 n=1 Tax=Elysia marginata TaxID=1093978 RepID=A0AAV4IJL2_9GAST|nr:ficolin-1 [Elysia marginata]
MEQRLLILSLTTVFLVSCQGLDLAMERGIQDGSTVRNLCGVLTCQEVINTSVPSNPGGDLAKSSIVLNSIAEMSLFIRVSTTSSSAKGKKDILIGSVSSQFPSLTRVANGRKVDGLLDPGQATMRVELVKLEDCQAEFTCQVRGLDIQGKELANSVRLAQQKDQGGNQMYDASFTPATSHLLTSIHRLVSQAVGGLKDRMKDRILQLQHDLYDKIDSLENRVEDRIQSLKFRTEDGVTSVKDKLGEIQTILDARIDVFENRVDDKMTQLQRDLIDKSDQFEHRLGGRLDVFENRIKNEIDSKINQNKLMRLDLSTQLHKFSTEMRADILNSLNTMQQRLFGEQNKALKNVSESVDRTLHSTSSLLSSFEGDFDLLKNYGEMNLHTVRNETETIRDILSSGEVYTQCMSIDSRKSDTDKPMHEVCERGMGDDVTKLYNPYEVMTHRATKKQILCDTHTDGGGWIVIQRRATGDVDFYKNWTAYRDGFGSVSGDFWIGNEVIYALTNQHPCELRIDFRIDGQEKFAYYSSFRIENESNKYRLRLATYSGTVGEASKKGLSYSNNRPFSTFDQDNDDSSRNCAIVFSGAWWYGDCHDANLNGNWGEKTTTGVCWSPASRVWYYPSFVELKLRRVPSSTSG